MMTDERQSAEPVVAERTDGMTIGVGGRESRRKPMVLVDAVLRWCLKNLWRAVRFASFEAIPVEIYLRLARQAGGTVEACEFDEGMLEWGLYAVGDGRDTFVGTRCRRPPVRREAR